MDFHLLNLRTRERVFVDPSQTLIGAAGHATVQTVDVDPFLAALAVCYPAGWAVHGLSDDPRVRFNRHPLLVGGRVSPRPGDLLEVGEDRFRFLADDTPGEPPPPTEEKSPPALHAYFLDPDGMEECRAVDHDLLIGRLSVCHVQFPDPKLSRVTALLAAHAGGWYVHALAGRPIVARNRELVVGFAPLADGDELMVGPLTVRIEIGSVPALVPPTLLDSVDAAFSTGTDDPTGLDAAEPSEPIPPPDDAVRVAGLRLDQWLRSQSQTSAPEGGLGGWLAAQRDRVSRFWYDTPEATAARGLRAAGRVREAFAVLDRAVRAHPDSPALLRELYRLYEATGLTDLCFRPLRQIEKLAARRGADDPWVLGELARVCERLGRDDPALFERALRYWDRLEAATGVSYARERSAAMATKSLRDGGFAGAADDGA
jgi:hypothetical protein